MTIFGISIGTTRTGVAIIKDGMLFHAQVHNYMTPWSDEKLAKMLKKYREYIEKYAVNSIVIKVPPTIYHSKEIKLIMKEIELLALEYRCKFDLITKDELKAATDTKKTNELIMRAVQLYPELTGFYERGKKSYPHFQRMYEALLAARVYEQRLRMRDLRDQDTTE